MDDNNKDIDIMDAFLIFFGGEQVSIEWDTKSSRHSPIHRICSLTPTFFLILNQNNLLYEARFDQGHLKLRLFFLRGGVQDVQYCRDVRKLYIVVENGSVLVQTFQDDRKNFVSNNLWQAVAFDPLELSEEGVRIKRICCTSDGTLFISAAGDIYALGNCGVHFSVDDQPKLVRLFKSPMEILDLSAGDQFFVILARREKKVDQVTSAREYGELPDLVCSDIHHKNEYELSSSIDSSMSSCNLESNIQSLLRQGHYLLHTEVFTMGSVNRGLLGTGDHIKRDSILTIEKLKDIGICSLAVGSDHTVVRTIDGCLYHWGLNTQQQLTTRSQVYELSSPTELTFDSSDLDVPRSNILEACCGDYRTVLLNTQGEIYEGEKLLMHQEKDFVTLQMKDNSKQSYPLLLASSNLTIYNRRHFKRQFYTLHRHFQTQTKTMIGYHKKFQQLNKLVEKMILKDLQHVCYQWGNVLHLVIVILNSLEQLYRGDYYDSSELLVVKYCRECIQVFETYSKAYCDIYSIDGFYESQQMFQHSKNSKTTAAQTSIFDCSNEDILKMFKLPFQMYPYITQLLEQIQKTDGNCKNELLAWLEFVRSNRIDMELAENTRDFWRSNQKNTKIASFKRKERRVILSSTHVPIKLSHSMGLTSTIFILFSDCLCQVANHVAVYPLEAIWLKKDDSGITIKTPEKKFLLISRSHMDKDLWYDLFLSSIKSILNLSEQSRIPEVRSIDYNFSNHSIYSGVYAKGSFSNGVMHGKCRLEFPSGKIYAGDVSHGVIEGYGRMFLPKVGLYKGYFKNGKFCGHGTLIISEKEIYEGNFRNGLFHGHGHLQHSDYTYVGEFEDNLKCGYGVIDRLLSGEKYIGMFADNKRIGNGTCITSSGNYFEGYFANDELTGRGVAIFPNHYYYEGESSLTGPNGAGKYYMSGSESINQEQEPALTTNRESTITGNILTGQLSGTWESIRIHGNSSMEINVKYPKYPSSLGSHVVDNSRKWCSLFNDFENEIFEDLANATHSSCKAITFALWNRVIAFINKQQEIQNEKVIPRELDITNDTSPLTMKNGRRHWPSDDFDKLSLNSSLFSAEKLELNKSHSQSEDTLLNGFDFSNFDLLSTFNKLKHLSAEENQVNSSFATLMGIIDSCSTSAMDSFNDSALGNSGALEEECISLQTEMDLIPPFGLYELNEQDLSDIKVYLKEAFRYRYHPLKHLNDRIFNAFYRSYGCWKIKPTPLLAKQAMREWESISQRVYKFIRRLFPALPEEYSIVGEQREIVSHDTLLYPIVLSESIYSTLFVLYASKYSHKDDELYRQNLLQAEKLTDESLVNRLEFDSDLLAVVSTDKFSEAVQMLKEIKEKYSPMAMLNVIENCMEKLTHAYQQISENQTTSLNADVIMPLTLVLLLRAGIHHLGAELALLDDLTDSKHFQFEMNGIRGYCYTTLKASYEHLANKSLFENN